MLFGPRAQALLGSATLNMKTSFAGVSYAGLVAAAGIAAAALWLAPLPAAGQGPGGKGKGGGKGAYTAPRAGDGKADIQGIWEAWNTAADNVEAHNAATGIRAGKSFVVDPADGMIPYTPRGAPEAAGQFRQAGTVGQHG